MARVLELELFEDSGGEKHLSTEQELYCRRRHLEMKNYLEILARLGAIPEGKYERQASYALWKKL